MHMPMPMPETARAATVAELHALLDEGVSWRAEYGDGLANHLPMVLHALQAIGATPSRLRDYADLYAARLVPAETRAEPPLRALGPADLGRPQSFAALRAGFDAQIGRDGVKPTLAGVLPLLMPGVAAGAFHGLLRTAHGVACGHRGETASGLAYWASAYLPLVPPPAPTERLAEAGAGRSLTDWAAALLARPAPADADAPLIARRMSAWARSPGFADAAGGLRIDAARPAATLDALARFAARLYAATRNFTVLHIVTSCQAMRILADRQPDPGGAVRAYIAAVAAGLCAARLAPDSLASDLPAPMRWADILRRAIASDDDHMAKFVHACRSLEPALGGDVFLRAATRAVGEPASRAARSPASPRRHLNT